MDHSYEEIRKAAIEILSGREKPRYEPSQYQNFQVSVADLFRKREQPSAPVTGDASLSSHDRELFLEVFWDLFRQSIITIGYNDSNREFPFFRVSESGRKILEGQEPYFFHDVSSYEKIIKEQVPEVDSTTLLYLKEAMQAFMSGCTLSATVMIGVSIENTFFKLLEAIENNPVAYETYKNVFQQRTILQKLNKFKNLLDQEIKTLSPEIKEDLETNFLSILSMIRNFRNESGHPSGKIISREQCYILLQLFIPCLKKMHEVISHFKV